jgi:hypothetical protein
MKRNDMSLPFLFNGRSMNWFRRFLMIWEESKLTQNFFLRCWDGYYMTNLTSRVKHFEHFFVN